MVPFDLPRLEDDFISNHMYKDIWEIGLVTSHLTILDLE
jgi:hypothetical protein